MKAVNILLISILLVVLTVGVSFARNQNSMLRNGLKYTIETENSFFYGEPVCVRLIVTNVSNENKEVVDLRSALTAVDIRGLDFELNYPLLMPIPPDESSVRKVILKPDEFRSCDYQVFPPIENYDYGFPAGRYELVFSSLKLPITALDDKNEREAVKYLNMLFQDLYHPAYNKNFDVTYSNYTKIKSLTKREDMLAAAEFYFARLKDDKKFGNIDFEKYKIKKETPEERFKNFAEKYDDVIYYSEQARVLRLKYSVHMDESYFRSVLENTNVYNADVTDAVEYAEKEIKKRKQKALEEENNTK